jgi:hypothetical protein
MKRIIRLTESDLTRIVKQVIQEQSEHVKNLYKSWANKRSGNPEEALKLMDDVFKYQKKLSKKDFAQYSSYEELRRDLVKIKSEERSTDATKLYEDGELLVLAANTWEASCKYGAGSKWCTTARDTDSNWNRHNQTGTEFFWIFKNKPQNDPNHKFSYHIKIDGSDPDWCNAVNNCMSTRRLPEDSYPKQHPKYNEIIEKLQEFHNARDMKNVNQISNTQTVQFENQRIIEELITENAPQIMRLLMDNGISKTIMDNYEMAIESYLDTEVFDNLPDDLYDYDDDDAIEEYISDLEKYLQSKDIITFDRDMFYDMIGDLSYLVYNFLLDRNNFNAGEYFDEQDIDIVGVINDLINDNNYRYQYEEVIHEVVSLAASDEIYFAANNFRDKYEK